MVMECTQSLIGVGSNGECFEPRLSEVKSSVVLMGRRSVQEADIWGLGTGLHV